MPIKIKEVKSKIQLRKFIKFNLQLYRNNDFFVPSLVMDELLTLSRKKNPAFEYCETAYFLAYKNGKVVGRIAAIINYSANKRHHVEHGRFGWVDFIDDAEVSEALFKRAEEWVKNKGMKAIVGPMGLTDLDKEGLLIDGFDKMGTIATIYNYPYYVNHIEDLGYLKEIDWNEYLIKVPETFPDRYTRAVDFIKEKYKLSIKEFKNRKELVKNYGQKVFDLWNICYADLYGTSELSPKQIQHYIKLYFNVISLDTISVVVDDNDNVVAFGIALPSMSKALRKTKGCLFPFGIFHMIKALKKNDVVDLLLIGIHPDYQNKGVIALLFADAFPKYVKNGYQYCESNPELETNHKITAQWGYFEHTNHKRRRVYIKHF